MDRSSHRRCSVRKAVLRNFAKFTRKHLRRSLFLKKETLAQVLSCEFCEISRNTFFHRHLWWLCLCNVTSGFSFNQLMNTLALVYLKARKIDCRTKVFPKFFAPQSIFIIGGLFETNN